VEKFSIECTGCGCHFGSFARADAMREAVDHLTKKHRLVKFPHPALEMVRLHPHYTLQVVSASDVSLAPATEADPGTIISPEGGAPGEGGGGGTTGAPTTEN
jgi:hypothetical protein